MADRTALLPHENPQQFIDALGHTASETGFNARLVEKDYFCSVVLQDLRPLFDSGLVFKGGTALSKVYAGFHRLSEDLDFSISIETSALPSARRKAIQGVKAHLQGLPERVPAFAELHPLAGANKSTQYNGVYAYTSQITGQPDTIKVEVALREVLVDAAETRLAKTILIDPLTSGGAIVDVPVTVMSLRESYAEKIRAALSRREAAIRDLFDLDHAIIAGILDASEPELLALVKQKLLVNPGEPALVSDERFDAFRMQVETSLRPVLRSEAFARFDVERVFEWMRDLEQRLR